MSKRVLFYDPHPNDGSGCGEDLPVSIAAYIKQVDGVVMPLDEFIETVQELDRNVGVEDSGDYVRLTAGRHFKVNAHECREFNWRLIRYHELEPVQGEIPNAQ